MTKHKMCNGRKGLSYAEPNKTQQQMKMRVKWFHVNIHLRKTKKKSTLLFTLLITIKRPF